MRKEIGLGLTLVLCAGVAWVAPQAQSVKQFTVRILDGRNGERIVPNNIEVRINRERALHVEWVKMNDDGTATVTVPAKATAISVRATYDNSTEYYVNCDVARQKDTSTETWFPLADVLAHGLVMPDECWKSKSLEQDTVKANSGEFVLMVRKRSIRDPIPYSIPY